MNVKIDLKETSQAITYTNVKNTYTKGPFYCVYCDNKVTKIPIDNIFRIVEDYGTTASS